MREESKYEIFESNNTMNFQGNSVWKMLRGKPNYQGAKRYYEMIRLERRLVDYFYERLYEEKDSHCHWILIVKYGSKIIYLSDSIENFSKWFFSDSILVQKGPNWEYKNRKPLKHK